MTLGWVFLTGTELTCGAQGSSVGVVLAAILEYGGLTPFCFGAA